MSQPAPFDRAKERVRRVTCFAPAKINLALHVTGQRADGYHELETLAVFCDMGDWIEVGYAPLVSAGHVAIRAKGSFAGDMPDTSDNVAFKSAKALSAALGRLDGGLDITIEKNLPVASGIGGGSADAAATLIALARFANEPNGSNLDAMAANIGADVPMCLYSRPLVARGTGEKIETLEGFPDLHLVLVNPGVAVSTPEVFKRLVNRRNPPLPPLPDSLSVGALTEWLASQRNDLQAPAIALAPEIAEVLEVLERTNPLLARMSGSGATCFGLYAKAGAAQTAASTIAEAHPDWWVKAAQTGAFGRNRTVLKEEAS